MKTVGHEAPVWLNPKLLDSELIGQINTAAADVAEFAAKALEMMERVRPVQEAWRLFCATQDAPDEVLYALDDVSGFNRLDDLLRDLWQFLQHATERVDVQPVMEGFQAILAGREARSVHQLADGSPAARESAAEEVRAVADAVVLREARKRRLHGAPLDGGGTAVDENDKMMQLLAEVGLVDAEGNLTAKAEKVFDEFGTAAWNAQRPALRSLAKGQLDKLVAEGKAVEVEPGVFRRVDDHSDSTK